MICEHIWVVKSSAQDAHVKVGNIVEEYLRNSNIRISGLHNCVVPVLFWRKFRLPVFSR